MHRGASVPRLVRASQRWMLAGFAASFAGSMLVEGGLQGLIAAGVLGVVFIPAFATLTTLEDLASPLAARLVERFPAARVLVFCEGVDVALSVALLVGLIVAPERHTTLVVGYLALASLIPVFIDLAEEFFAEEASRLSPGAAAAFTANIATASALLSRVIALPMGAGLATVDIRIVVVANIVLSVTAVVLRAGASRRLHQGQKLDHAARTPEGPQSTERPSSAAPVKNRDDVRAAWEEPTTSPITSAMVGSLRALFSGYLSLWMARAYGTAYLTPALACLGLGAVVGPQVARWLRHRGRVTMGLRRLPLIHAAVGVLLLGLTTQATQSWTLPAALVLLVGYSAIPATLVITMAMQRQIHLGGPAFRSTVGWAHSLSAVGALIGTWMGLFLGMPARPAPALVVAVALAVTIAVWASWRRGSPARSSAGTSRQIESPRG